MAVAIIDYGSGNLRSAAKAFERAARDAGRDIKIEVTSDPEKVLSATHIVLPGVGAYGDCIQNLRQCDGMVEALQQAVIRERRPFLGICVGMQLMATAGHEFGDHEGLGWIEGDVVALQPDDHRLKVPHMGWNDLSFTKNRDHPVLDGINDGAHAYFVHSFHFRTAAPAELLSHTQYGGTVAAIIGRDNIIGTQFHPEKSQATGLRLITNFLNWSPAT